MIRERLNDRVNLNLIETDKFKSNFISLSFVVPFSKETATKNALLLKVLKRGTSTCPDMIALSKKLEYLYSAEIFTKTSSFGEVQLLQFSLDVLDNRFAQGTDILAEGLRMLGEIIFSPLTENGAFKESYFESEKRNLLDDIDSEINSKAKYALQRLGEHMFGEEKYRIGFVGERETVETFTNAGLFEHYQSLLDSADIEITFVGKTDFDVLKQTLREVLSTYMPTRSVSLGTEVIRVAKEVREIREECVGKQGNLVLGFRTGTVLADGDYPRMALLSELYGGSANSMLFMNVREKMSLCYYCASVPEAVKGTMLVRAGIENENYEKARDEILHQLNLLQNGEFTEEMLDSAKLSLINAYREISDNPQSLQNWYIGRLLSGITQSPEEAIAVVETLSKADIVATAKKITLDTVYFLEGVQNGGAN